MLLILLCAGCHSSEQKPTELYLAYPTEGAAYERVLDEVVAEFETQHPDVKIKRNSMEDDLYQDVGLLTLFTGSHPPDIYGQWAGWLVQRDVQRGYTADLTEVLKEEKWQDNFLSIAWQGTAVDGKTYMLPASMDISIVLWYNTDIFRQRGLAEPKDWDELQQQCQVLKTNGIIPLGQGNKTLWPMGNWAAQVVSRIAGEKKYQEVFQLRPGTRFADPDFIRGLELFGQMARAGYFNEGINGRSESEGMMLFFNGHCALHPLGSWLISQAGAEVPNLNYDGFNTPPIADGKGDQLSIIGVAFGFMIGKQTKHFDFAVAFLKHLTSTKTQKKFAALGILSTVKGAFDESTSEPHLKKLVETLRNTETVIPPPDTGFSTEVAAAFYDAVALVVGGQMTAKEALEIADERVEPLRKVNP